MKTFSLFLFLALGLSAFASEGELKIFQETKSLQTNRRFETPRLCTESEIEFVKDQAMKEAAAACKMSGVSTCIAEAAVVVTNEIVEEFDCNTDVSYGYCAATAVVQGSSRKNFLQTLTPGKIFAAVSKPKKRLAGSFCEAKNFTKQIATAVENARTECAAAGYELENCAVLYADSHFSEVRGKNGVMVDVCVAEARVRGYR